MTRLGRRLRAGFTLVEMAVVTSVVAILAAMAVQLGVASVNESRAVACEKNRVLYEDMELQFMHKFGRASNALQELVTGKLVNKATCPSGGVLAWEVTDPNLTYSHQSLVCSFHGPKTRIRIATAGSAASPETPVVAAPPDPTPAPAPTVPVPAPAPPAPAPAVAFSDSFGLPVAVGWTPATGKKWQIVNGRYQASSTGGGGEHRSFAGSEAWTDYTLDVNASIVSGKNLGVYFRTTNAAKPTGYLLQYAAGSKGTGTFSISPVSAGKIGKAFATAAPAGFNWATGSRALSIDVSGSTFTVSVDGKQVLKGSDAKYTKGAIGLRVSSSTVASFDDVKVTAK